MVLGDDATDDTDGDDGAHDLVMRKSIQLCLCYDRAGVLLVLFPWYPLRLVHFTFAI